MKIVQIATRNIRFPAPTEELERNLSSSTSIFEDHESRPGGWLGPAACTLVGVETDTGLIGVGVAGALHGGAKPLIDSYYAAVLKGEDPRRHEYLWQRMFRSGLRFGRSGSAMAAIAALDIACWDLHAKAENAPLCDMLGGRTQSSLPCCLSRLYAPHELSELSVEVRTWRSKGFTRMKQRFACGPRHGVEGMRRNLELVRTVREAAGADLELAADANMGWDLNYAIEMTHRLRDFNLAWIEEPLLPQETDGYAELKRRCPWQRFSAGEHCFTKWEFKELIDKRAVDILQPDAARAGGITETLKISVLAEAAGLPLIPHSNEAPNLHLAFSRPAQVCPMIQYVPNVEPDLGNELFWRIFEGNPEAENGRLRLAESPGLGIRVRGEAVGRLQL